MVQLETVIWKAIFDIACGVINVYDAAELIAKAIPNILNDIKDGDVSWFNLGLSLHLTHFNSHSIILYL